MPFFAREEDETDLTESNIAQQFLERSPPTLSVLLIKQNDSLILICSRFLDGGKSKDPLVLQNWFTHTVSYHEEPLIKSATLETLRHNLDWV